MQEKSNPVDVQINKYIRTLIKTSILEEILDEPSLIRVDRA